MKKRIITTIAAITLIGGVTAGALMSQPEETPEPKAQTVQEVKEPTTAPKPVESEEKEEMTTNPTPTPKPTQSAPEPAPEPVVEAKTMEEYWKLAFPYIRDGEKSRFIENSWTPIVSAVAKNLVNNPSIDVEDTAVKCLDYYNSFVDQREISMAKAKFDCGL